MGLEDKENLEQFPKDIHKFLKDNIAFTVMTFLTLSYCLFGAIYYLVIKPYYLGSEMTNELIFSKIVNHVLPIISSLWCIHIVYFFQLLYRIKKLRKRSLEEKGKVINKEI